MDGAACPPVLVSCQPACGLLKHPVQVGHPRAPIGSWPPADPSLAVTQTDATGRQAQPSPRMGQLILLWPSWHLLGTTLRCLTTLTVPNAPAGTHARRLFAVIVQCCRSQEAPSVRLLLAYAGPCGARKKIRLHSYCHTRLPGHRLFSYPAKGLPTTPALTDPAVLPAVGAKRFHREQEASGEQHTGTESPAPAQLPLSTGKRHSNRAGSTG